MFSKIIKLLAFLQREQGLRIKLTLLLMMLASVADAVSVATLMPYLKFMINPDVWIENNFYLSVDFLPRNMTRNEVVSIVTAIYCLIVLVSALVKLYSNKFITEFSFTAGLALSGEIYKKYLHSSYVDAIKRPSSQVIGTVVYNTDGVVYQILMPVLSMIGQFLTLILMALGVAAINTKVLLLAALGLVTLYSSMALPVRGRFKANGEIITRTLNLSLKTLQEGIGAIRDVILDKRQDYFSQLYVSTDQRRRVAQAENMILAGRPRIIAEAVFVLVVAVFIYYVSSSGESLVDFIPLVGLLVLIAAKCIPQLQSIYLCISNIKSGESALDDVIHCLADRHLPGATHEGDPQSVSFDKEITLNEVSFFYQGRKVLNDINLKICKGERVAIVGPSGSGKSTLIDVIMGLLPEYKGEIYVDGVLLGLGNSASWQDLFGHVPQNVYLLDDLIEKNIQFMRGAFDEKSSSKVADVAERAGLGEMLRVEQAQATRRSVGERGVNISGGQRQRIGIARALYKSDKFIILDEATSALDRETEYLILKNLFEQNVGTTIIMVTHHMHYLSLFDSVYVLDKGVLSKANK